MSISPALLATVIRSGRIESQHYGHLAVVDANCNVVYSLGDPDFTTYMRSAAKPFQAIPLFEDEIPEAFGLNDAEQAVMMSSHNGEARHVEAVSGILKKIGCAPENLHCGLHVPLGVAAAKQLTERGQPLTVLHNNCSGKHAGMLAACVYHHWPIENYLAPEHPHQRRLHQTMAEWAKLPVSQIWRGLDGCSAPVFHLPLYNMARMYAALVASQEKISQTILRLFTSHPEMIAGDDRFDTEIMLAAKGRVMAKIGAEGMECMGITRKSVAAGPLGIAIKMIDGANRAIPPVLVNVLHKLGVLDDATLLRLEKWRRVRIQNHRGIETGFIEAVDIELG
jgi:L-asparaginase II